MRKFLLHLFIHHAYCLPNLEDKRKTCSSSLDDRQRFIHPRLLFVLRGTEIFLQHFPDLGREGHLNPKIVHPKRGDRFHRYVLRRDVQPPCFKEVIAHVLRPVVFLFFHEIIFSRGTQTQKGREQVECNSTVDKSVQRADTTFR